MKAQPLLDSLKGGTLNTYNADEVRDALKAKHAKTNKKGKVSYNAAMSAFRTYKDILEYGYEKVKDPSFMNRRTFDRHVKMLVEAGVQKAFLQNAVKDKEVNKEVIDISNVLFIDFEDQLPLWQKNKNKLDRFFDEVEIIDFKKAVNRGQKARLST